MTTWPGTDDYDGHLARLGGQILTGIDPYGVEWKALDLGGWYGASASSLSTTQKSRAPGAWRGAAPQQAQKNISLSGQLEAPTPAAAREAIDRLNAAIDLDGSLLEVDQAGLVRHHAVVQGDEPMPKYETDTLVTWSVAVVALDPRKLGDDLAGATKLPSQSGGVGIPFDLPSNIDGLAVSGQVQLINPGNTTGRVMVRFAGPVTGPRVLHVESGLLITLPNLTLAAGQYVDIDMEGETVRANGGVSRNRNLAERGWSGFLPGVNTWAFLADKYDPAAAMTVTATPSWK